jgi:O-antigen ligase
MVRNVSGVVLGAVVWMVGFFVLVQLLAQLWPDYAIHGREWIRQGVFTFTPVMACLNLAFWFLAEIGAGWTVAKIAKRREALWILAGIVGIYLASEHLVLHWSRFPWWYNVGVVIPAVAAVLVGGKLTVKSSGLRPGEP